MSAALNRCGPATRSGIEVTSSQCFFVGELTSEDVFDAWNVSTLRNYCAQNDMHVDAYDVELLLKQYIEPPVGFLQTDDVVHVDSPYWQLEDLMNDILTLRQEGMQCAKATRSLHHDDMTEFLYSLLEQL